MQTSVLPYISLVQTIPAYADTLSALIEDVRLRAREVKERHGRIPLLLVDDLEHLLLITRARPLSLVLSRLDNVLAADSMPGLLAMTEPDLASCGVEGLPVQTVLSLVSAPPCTVDNLERVDLEVQTNAGTDWTGKLPLLLDRRSGLFAQASTPETDENISLLEQPGIVVADAGTH